VARLSGRQRNPLGRTVRLLGWMADHEAKDFGVRQLAAAVGMAPSTVHRSLGALEEEGLVESDPDSGRYRLSLGFYRLALKGARRAPLRDLARPFVLETARAAEEACQLAVYGEIQLAVMYLLEMPSLRQLQVRARLHEWQPLTSSAAGLAILSRLDSESVVAAFANGARGGSGADLAERLDQVRRQGFAATVGWTEPGCVELAAPFSDAEGRVHGALCLGLPEVRFSRELEGALGNLLMVEAAKLSRALAAPPQES
jgi:DNA-binding IclR family transcriptional regulator